MRLAVLTLVVLFAFAGNSILNRLAVASGAIDPIGFLFFRLVSGAVILGLITRFRRHSFHWRAAIIPAFALFVYGLGFSLAYLTLNAGVGALILFGSVQLTMFAGAVICGDRPRATRWVGMVLGVVGLVILVNPNVGAFPASAVLAMVVAGIAWGFFSLRGRAVSEPTDLMASAFILTVPLALVLVVIDPSHITNAQGNGVLLAVIAGIVTSGLGYAQWYAVLPKIDASLAAVSQLAVPIIVAVLGVVLLGEAVGWRFFIASLVTLGGIALAVIPRRRDKAT